MPPKRYRRRGGRDDLAVELRRVAANSGWLLLAKAFGALLSLAYLAIATRTLGLADFGRFALVVAIGQALAGIVGFQTWQFVVRYGMAARAQGDHAGVDRIVGVAAVLDLAAAVVGSVLALATIVVLGPVLELPRELYGAALGFCFAILIAIRSTPTGVLRLDDRFRDAALADSVSPMFRAAGAAAAALLLPSVTGFLCAWALAELVTAGVFWWAALRQRTLALSLADLRRTFREEPSLWRFLFATNLSSTMTLTTKQFTLIAVGAVGGPAAAGMFRLAGQLAQALVKVTQTFSRAAYAELVRSLAGGGEQALLLQLTATAGLAAVAMVALAALAGEPLLHLIASREFSGAYLPIVLLVAAASLDLCGFAFEPAMTARGRAGEALRLRVFASVAQAALLFALLPPFGTVGGAWATLGGSLIALLLTGWGALGPASRARAGAG